ncbi:uncharacterized protein CIMG_12801 [Coccidioides immitis RS]|uniref:Uncharacterized protein n=1 Tax=Coccidioides immitis (strain RS) TaxID=246410 RepID=A0A0D8JSF0_COCIM|nr:uncharacterized protein CIMG_12801 [Coccidioides immitis RS]KJF60202.1 hypothetical protein CIMG_12801 [Coccidioides immitis RS]
MDSEVPVPETKKICRFSGDEEMVAEECHGYIIMSDGIGEKMIRAVIHTLHRELNSLLCQRVPIGVLDQSGFLRRELERPNSGTDRPPCIYSVFENDSRRKAPERQAAWRRKGIVSDKYFVGMWAARDGTSTY